MNEVKKKILLDIFVTPSTVIPATLGASLFLMSFSMGGMLAFWGLLSLLFAFGIAFTNYFFGIDKISKDAIQRWRQQEKEKRDNFLDELDSKLVRDRDPRDQTALRNLRAIYDDFVGDLDNDKINKSVTPSMLAQVDEIFNACVAQLQKQFEIWEMSTRFTGSAKEKALAQREEIIVEVEKSVNNLVDVVTEIRSLSMKSGKSQLTELRRKLNIQLTAAKATDAFMAEIEQGDAFAHKEYEK